MKIQSISNLSFETNKNNNLKRTKNSQNINGIRYSVYNSTCPLGANYFSPSFGLKNPESAMKRAQMLKEKYAQKGLTYLLPNEKWSDKRIFKTLGRVGEKFDELASKKELSAVALGAVLAAILPQSVSDKIKVKDFPDLVKDLARQGYTKDEVVNIYQNYGGLTATSNDGATIYLPVERDKNTQKGICNLKSTFEHELKHALTSNCTNVFIDDFYKQKTLDKKTCVDETKFYNDMFMQLEQSFDTLANGEHVKLDKNHLVNFATNTKTDLMYDSEEGLMNDIDNTMKGIIQNKIDELKKGSYAIAKLLEYGYTDEKSIAKIAPDLVLNDERIEKICQSKPKEAKLIKNIIKQYMLPDDAFSSKAFWQFMQHRAMDERQAYTTDKELREVFGTKKEPVDYELRSMLYGEMEKYFRGKVKEAKD